MCRHMPPRPAARTARRRGCAARAVPATGGRRRSSGTRVFHPRVDGVRVVRRAPGARPGRTPTDAACRRTTGACRGRRRSRTRCRPAPRSPAVVGALDHLAEPAAGLDAYSRSGSAGDPLTW